MSGRELDAEVRQDLRAVPKDTADLVARHLVVAGRLLGEDPARALEHARAAGALAGRIAVVREAVGLCAYAASEWAEALSELRAARRISGRADHLAVLADCERALGRPERALSTLQDPDVPKLNQATRVELVIVVAGARRDLEQQEAAVLLLQGPARATTASRPWAARLWYAYGDALLAAGRADEARQWFARAAEHDGQGDTDAMDRLLEMDGIVLEDLQDDDDDPGAAVEMDAAELADLVAPLLGVQDPADRARAAPDPGSLTADSGQQPGEQVPSRPGQRPAGSTGPEFTNVDNRPTTVAPVVSAELSFTPDPDGPG